tara:strand:- start:954 stop:1325 length:372 start_codon:yes stop_codon:yes gene_type:complete
MMLDFPIQPKLAGRLESEKPSVRTNAKPRAIDIVPRVAISGLMLKAVTKQPLERPINAPSKMLMKTETGIEYPESISIATTVEDKAITEPTERSNPPDANKIAIPITMMAVGAIPTEMALKFE